MARGSGLFAARLLYSRGDTIIEQRQIIAIGGRLLLPSAGNALERYIIAATGDNNPDVCFIPTASGDDAAYVSRFYEIYAKLGAKPKHLPLFGRTPRDLRSYLLSNKIIHVGGGNTRSMIALWRYWGIDTILREAWEAGIVLTGSSAGMICWFASGVTDSLEGPLTTCEGLGFIPTSSCPHFNGEAERRPAYSAMIASGELAAGYAADDGAGLHFRGTELETAISAYPNATAYAYERDNSGNAVERIIPARNIA